MDRNPYKPKQVFFKHVARVVSRSQCSDPINLMDAQLFVQHRCHIYIYTYSLHIYDVYCIHVIHSVFYMYIIHVLSSLWLFQIPTLIYPFPSDKKRKRKKTCTNCQADLTSIAKAARKEWQDGEVAKNGT